MRCSNLISLTSGQDLTPDKYNDKQKGIPYITGASNFNCGHVIINRWTQFPKAIAEQGNILLTCKGTIGELALLKETQVHIARQVMAIQPIVISLCDFLMLILEVNVQSFKAEAQSMIPGISREVVLEALIPLPPTLEQNRIVSKLKILLPEIEKYGVKTTTLNKINSDFPVSLKKSILQHAIQGKLVPQDPTDEPARVLLDRIAKERAKLGKKAAKSMSRIERRDRGTYEIFPDGSEKNISGELPFDIPEFWEWCRIGSFLTLQAGKFISARLITEKSECSPYPCYGGNGKRGYVGIFNRDGDYPLIGRQGALCGNINRATGKFYATEHAVCVEYFYRTNVDWLCLFLRALNLNQYATATAQPGLAVSTINEVLLPIPPLEEQNRIAAIVNKLSKDIPI